jgi:hypothetical protein
MKITKVICVVLSMGLLSTGLVAQAQRPNLEPGLNTMARNGVPAGWTEATWLSADGEMTVGASEEGKFEVVLELTGLVPEGTYAVWGASRRALNVRISPLVDDTPSQFTATAEGTATHTLSIPTDHNHSLLVISYHPEGISADNEPGDNAFGQFIAEFPEPAN